MQIDARNKLWKLISMWRTIGPEESMCEIRNRRKGQALVALLVFMIIAITITSAAIVIAIINSQGASNFYQGLATLDIAESGTENALIRLLRDPNYPGDPEPFPVGEGSTIATVSGTTTKTINATGYLGNFSRKIQVTVVYNNNMMTIQSWKEIP
jgi:hypothetical protein